MCLCFCTAPFILEIHRAVRLFELLFRSAPIHSAFRTLLPTESLCSVTVLSLRCVICRRCPMVLRVVRQCWCGFWETVTKPKGCSIPRGIACHSTASPRSRRGPASPEHCVDLSALKSVVLKLLYSERACVSLRPLVGRGSLHCFVHHNCILLPTTFAAGLCSVLSRVARAANFLTVFAHTCYLLGLITSQDSLPLTVLAAPYRRCSSAVGLPRV